MRSYSSKVMVSIYGHSFIVHSYHMQKTVVCDATAIIDAFSVYLYTIGWIPPVISGAKVPTIT